MSNYAQFEREWSARRVEYLSRWGATAGVVINIGVLFLFMRHDAANPRLMLWGHAIIQVALLAWGTLLKLKHPAAPVLGGVTGFAVCVLYAINLRLNIVNPVDAGAKLASACAYLAVSVLFSLLGPLRPRVMAVLATIYVLLGAWAMSENPVMMKWLYLHIVTTTLAWGFGLLSSRRSAHEALLEWRDLSFAREIQESLLPAPSISAGRLELQCFQAKHATVCGDWMAVRALGDGRALAVVADATGNGVHAALVVQAVQTLWVDALSDGDTLAPRAWIERVNRALLVLGERKPQTVTLGLLEISPGRVVYWSAGHIPLHVRTTRRDTRSGDVVVSGLLLVARGNPLGLYSTMALEPATLLAPEDTEIELMLGSDGVFEGGTLYNQRRILKLFEQASREGGEALLGRSRTSDDKSLIMARIEPRAAGHSLIKSM